MTSAVLPTDGRGQRASYVIMVTKPGGVKVERARNCADTNARSDPPASNMVSYS
jgi:hypothetical protein